MKILVDYIVECEHGFTGSHALPHDEVCDEGSRKELPEGAQKILCGEYVWLKDAGPYMCALSEAGHDLQTHEFLPIVVVDPSNTIFKVAVY